MHLWFGSSGGGLPRRLGLESLGRFLVAFALVFGRLVPPEAY
jgi:hypothetical protein